MIQIPSLLALYNCSMYTMHVRTKMFIDGLYSTVAMFLTPYSPDYNPTEKAFSYVNT